MNLVYQYIAIFLNFPPTSNHFHPLQVKNCGSNLRLVVDKDDYGKFRLERIIQSIGLKCIKHGADVLEGLVLLWVTDIYNSGVLIQYP